MTDNVTDSGASENDETELAIPDLCLVVLIGATGSGKSTFAANHFAATEIVSSDRARGMVSDDENDQSATADAFDLVRYWAAKRLANGKLTVVDATNVQAHARKPLVQLAREHDVLPVAVVIDTPVDVCHARNRDRPDRNFGPHVARKHNAQLRKSIRRLKKEGFRYVHHLQGVDQIEAASIVRQRRWTDLRDRTGPFDIIGDIHGCHTELVELLDRLGYEVNRQRGHHPQGRTAVFVGDLVDRGPGVPETLELVMNMVADGQALCVAGNHEAKLERALQGRDVQRTHGLPESLEQLARWPDEFVERVKTFLDGLISHYLLDEGRLVVCHAGLPERFHNRSSGRVRGFCLYGETTGETDEFGLPVRYQWANDYRGDAAVVYGHTPVPDAEWINNTICLDTGCVFGGTLTALRWPERELVSVPAQAEHYAPLKPLRVEESDPVVLELGDVTGRRHVKTPEMGRLAIDEDHNAAALELMSRFTVDPRWLAYLPPTMAPAATAADGPMLERPAEAFGYYRSQGLSEVICQEKHMGSRAVAFVCRTPETARERFGFNGGADREAGQQDGRHAGRSGMITTRTGRRFFDDDRTADTAVDRIRTALDAADAWERHGTDWFIIDGEILPWSAKADPLIRHTYAATGAAGALFAAAAVASLDQAAGRGVDGLDELLHRTRQRGDAVDRFRAAYRPYVTEVNGLDGVAFAPFAILATEGAVTARNDNHWHLAECDRLVDAAPDFIRRTERTVVDLADEASCDAGTRWWEELTSADGEGMVVKPIQPVSAGPKGLIQPGLKCRGPEYLRMVYGPEYLVGGNLERLRNRRLNRKRSLALREFALGLAALDHFVAREPLYRFHECVFSILALESEPVDSRL